MSCSSLLLSFRWCVLFSYSRAINRIITHRGKERKRETIDMHARYQCSKAMIILHKQNQQTHAYIWCAHTQFKRRIKYEHDPPTRSWLVVLHKDSFAYTRTHTPNTAERMHMHTSTSTRTHTGKHLSIANRLPLHHHITCLQQRVCTQAHVRTPYTNTKNVMYVPPGANAMWNERFRRQLEIESVEQIMLSMWQHVCMCANPSFFPSWMCFYCANTKEQMDFCYTPNNSTRRPSSIKPSAEQ